MEGTLVSNMKPTNHNCHSIPRDQSGACRDKQSFIEKGLLARARAGEEAAIEELLKRAEPRLLRMARNIVRNEEDAQDAVPEALLNAYVNLSSFDERSSFFTWATRITINSSLMLLRKRRQFFLRFTGDDPQELDFQDPAPNPEALLAEKDERRTLKEAIRSLPPTLRVAVEPRQFQERSVQEMASALSISCTAAKARFFRAKEILRNRIVPHMSARRASTFRAPIIAIPSPSKPRTGQSVPASSSLLARRSALAETA
jgi:RNA polymerase sigma-70 factor (ECF subfamily)